MKKKIKYAFFGLGWLLLVLLLVSSYFIKRFDMGNSAADYSSISWERQVDFFKGAIQCSLTDSDLLERKELIRADLLSRLDRKEELSNGFVFYFKDEPGLLDLVMEFIEKEKACCPFFKFDLSVLPFDQGIALGLSGAPGAVELIREF